MATNQKKPGEEGLWNRIGASLFEEKGSEGGLKGLGNRVLRIIWLSVTNALENRLPFQASALTFVTLLGLVPTLALVFAVAKGFGFAETLRSLLIEQFTDYQREVLDKVLQYVENTKVGTLGAVGLLLMIFTVVTTVASVEDTFNRIWHVREQRPWSRRFADYLSVMLVVPFLTVAGAAMWAGVSSASFMQWLYGTVLLGDLARIALRVLPVLVLVAAFTFLYTYLPNTKVPVRSSSISGLVAAILWWIVQTIYIKFQIGVAKYNAIYGGFASLPLFMAWLQVSWTIVLFGCELAHAHHVCRRGFSVGPSERSLWPAEVEAGAIRVMVLVAKGFDEGKRLVSRADLQTLFGAQVEGLVSALAKASLLVEDHEGRLLPGRAPDRITLRDVVEAVRGAFGDGEASGPEKGALEALLAAESQRLKSLEKVTIQEVVRRGM